MSKIVKIKQLDQWNAMDNRTATELDHHNGIQNVSSFEMNWLGLQMLCINFLTLVEEYFDRAVDLSNFFNINWKRFWFWQRYTTVICAHDYINSGFFRNKF